MKIWVIGFLLLMLPAIAFGQARTTSQPGPWNSTATWGGLSVPDNTFGVITVNHAVTVDADLSINQTTISATGSVTVDPLITLTLVGAAGVELTVAGTLTINGSLVNSGAATITYSGASLVNNGTLNIGTNTLTWSGSGTLSGTGNTTVGDLSVTGTSFTYTASGSLTLNDDIIGTGTFNSSGGGTVIFAGATSAISGSTPKVFNNLQVTGVMTPALNVSYTVTGNISGTGTLAAGSGTSTTTFSGSTLISGSGAKNFFDVTINLGTAVTYSSNVGISGANLIVNGSLTTDVPTSPAIITFTTLAISGTGTKDFTNVTIGTGASTTPNTNYTIRGNLVVTGTLLQTSGTVTFDGTTAKSGAGACTFNNVVVNSGASFSSTTSHTINGAFTNNGIVNFTAGTLTLGAASVTTLANLPAFTTFNALTTTAGSTITDGATSSTTITGAFAGAGSYVSLGTTTFNGTVAMSGAGTKTFNDLIVNGTSLTPGANISYTVTGNISGTGTLAAGSGTSTTTFAGVSTLISGSGAKIFFDVTINLGTAVTYNSNVGISGVNLIVNGSLATDVVTSPAIITFTTLAISGTGTKDFTNVTIGTGASTTPNTNYTIRGNLVVTGTLLQTSGTVTFAGTTAKSGAGACTFNNVVVNSGATFSSTTSHTINGAFTNNGIVNFTAGTLTLGAASVTTLANLPASTTFNALTTTAGSTITDGATSSTTITGAFVGGGSYISLGTTTFNGAVAMSGTGTKTFNNLVVNGVSMTPNAAYTVNGNISGTGTLAAGNNTATFAGTTLISGSGAKSFNNFTVNNGSAVTYNKDISITGTTLLVNATGSLSTDIPTSPAIISFTSAAITGTGVKDFTFVTIAPGASTAPSNYTVRGNLVIDGSLVSTGTPTFAGATTISGAGALTFTDVNVSGTVVTPASLTLSAGTIRVNGNINVNSFGTVNRGSGTLQFGGNSTITNTGTINVNNVSFVAGGNVLNAPTSIMGIGGNFTTLSAGNFNPNGGTIDFNGTGLQTLSGVAEVFNNVTVSNTSPSPNDFRTANSQTVNGNFVNNGSITFTAGTLTLGVSSVSTFAVGSTTSVNILTLGANGATIAANGSLNIAGVLTINTGASITAGPSSNVNISTAGNFVGTGDYVSTGMTTFNGTVALTGIGTKTFNDLIVDGTSVTPAVNVSYTVNGDLSGIGILNAGTGTSTTTFGGTTAISGSGAKNFNNVVVNSSATVSSTLNHSISGTTFTNNGTINFTAGTLTLGASTVTTLADLPASSTTFNALTTTAGSAITAGTLGNASSVTITGDFAGAGSYTSNGTTTFNGTVAMSGTGVKTFTELVVNGTSLTPGLNISYTVNGNLSGTGILNAGTGTSTTTFGGTTIISGSGAKSFNGVTVSATSSLTLPNTSTNIAGDLTIDPTSTFTVGTGTVVLDGGVQSIGGASIMFNNLTLSGTGLKTFNASTAIADVLRINTNAIAGLSNAFLYTANTLTFDGTLQVSGTWGNTGSGATNPNPTFFSGNGLVTVTFGSNTFYSKASADWSLNTTWSNTGFSGPDAATPPVAGALVFIGGGFTVAITDARTCSELSLALGSTLQISSSPASLAVTGNVTGTGASSIIQFTGNGTLQLGGSFFSTTNGTLTTFAGSTVEYNGTVQTVEAHAYTNLTLSGSGIKTLQVGMTSITENLTLSSLTTLSTAGVIGLTIGGDVNIGVNTTFTSGAFTHNVGGNWINNGTFTANTSTITFDGGAVQTISGSNSQFYNLSVDKSGNSLSASTAQTVTNLLTLTAGQVSGSNLSLSPGATIDRAEGSFTVASPSGDPWNLIYSGTADINPTGFEIPASGDLMSLDKTGAAAITLDQSLTIGTGGFTMSVGTFTAPLLSISTSSLSISGGTFTAPLSTLTITTGDFSNSGSFTNNSGVVIFTGGAQSITGSATTFNNLTLAGTGTKTFSASTTIGNVLSILNTSAKANLSNANTYTANSLSLSGAPQIAGTWGSLTSTALNKDGDFFSGNGLVTVTTGTNTFYSIANDDWSVNTTWSNSGFSGPEAATPPIAGALVFIGGGFTVTVNSGESISNTLTLTSGILSIPANNLSISPGVTIVRDNGVISGTSPMGGPWNVTYLGASKDSGLEIPSSGIITDMTISLNANQTINLVNPVNLTGVLNITNDNNSVQSNFGTLTLISNSSGTASIGQLLGNRSVIGDVIIERYIAGVGTSAYRDVSFPVTGPDASVGQLINSGISVTGTLPITSFGGDCPGCLNNNPSIYFYEEATSGTIRNGYVPIISSNYEFLPRRGYNMFLRGAAGNETMRVVGEINRYPTATDLPVTYTPSLPVPIPADDGWNFIGNPFPCAIDWDNAAGWGNKGTIQGNQISVWDPTKNAPNGGYKTWNGTAGDLGNGRIAMGQGFWVKRTGAGAALTIDEQAKSTTPTAFFRTKSESTGSGFAITLHDDVNQYEDMAFVRLNAEATDSFDRFDGVKLKSPFFNLSTLSRDFVPLANNNMASIPVSDHILLEISEVDPGAYSLIIHRSNELEGTPIYIHDKLTGKSAKITASPYHFTITTSSESQTKDRFYLYFNEKQSELYPQEGIRIYPVPVENELHVVVSDPEINSEMSVIDQLGRHIGKVILNNDNEIRTGVVDMSGAPSGLYFIQSMKRNKLTATKFIKR